MGSNQKGGEEKEQEEGQSSSEINEEGKGVAESHEINLQECAEISNDSIAPMALLTQFRPSCALPLQEFEVSVYDPDNNYSFLVILNYLSCTCCRAETLFSLGYWPMSPINPTYALPIYAMKKLFKIINLIIESTISLFFLTLSSRDFKDQPRLMMRSLAFWEDTKRQPVLTCVICNERANANQPLPVVCLDACYVGRRIRAGEPKFDETHDALPSVLATPSATNSLADGMAGKTITGHNKKGRDFLGVLGACCKHECFLGGFLMEKKSESYIHAGMSILQLRQQLGSLVNFSSISYDIAWKIKTWLLFLFPELQATFLGVGNFHVWAHAVWCRMVYALRRNHESGICDGEAIERIWSFEKIRGSDLSMSPANYWHNLGQRLVEINIQKFKNLATFLKTKAKLLQTKISLNLLLITLHKNAEFVHSSEVIRKYMDVKDELKCIEEEFKLLDQDKEHFQAYLNREANSLASMRATALAAAGPGTSSQSLESILSSGHMASFLMIPNEFEPTKYVAVSTGHSNDHHQRFANGYRSNHQSFVMNSNEFELKKYVAVTICASNGQEPISIIQPFE
eukprot:g5127.t1